MAAAIGFFDPENTVGRQRWMRSRNGAAFDEVNRWERKSQSR